MYHKITIVGNLGKDPESRFTQSGTQVCNFSVATSEKWTGNDGQKNERTIWWKVSVFGKMSEACNNYLAKGSKVLVEGRMNADESGNPRIWQTGDGRSAASFEVVASVVKFLSSRGDGATQEHQDAPEAVLEESEIPF